jgi:hypothetical protein
VLTAAGAWELSVEDLATWAGWHRIPTVQSQAMPIRPLDPLPLPPAFEADLARAEAHFAAGRLHEALAALDRVPVGDSRRVAADRLRERIQRELLAVASTELPPTSSVPPSIQASPPNE